MNTCWICKDLSSPPTHSFCSCTNDFKNVHFDCLQSWIEYSKKDTCIFCNTKYSTKKQYLPIWKWTKVDEELLASAVSLSKAILVLLWISSSLILVTDFNVTLASINAIYSNITILDGMFTIVILTTLVVTITLTILLVITIFCFCIKSTKLNVVIKLQS